MSEGKTGLFVCVWPRCQWDGQLPRSLELWDIQSQAWLHAEGLGAGARQCAALPPLYWKQSQLAALGHHCQEEGVGIMLCYVRAVMCLMLTDYNQETKNICLGFHQCLVTVSLVTVRLACITNLVFLFLIVMSFKRPPEVSIEISCFFWMLLWWERGHLLDNNLFILTTIVLIHYFYVFIQICGLKRNPV